jgi:hypothetical protein
MPDRIAQNARGLGIDAGRWGNVVDPSAAAPGLVLQRYHRAEQLPGSPTSQ